MSININNQQNQFYLINHSLADLQFTSVLELGCLFVATNLETHKYDVVPLQSIGRTATGQGNLLGQAGLELGEER